MIDIKHMGNCGRTTTSHSAKPQEATHGLAWQNQNTGKSMFGIEIYSKTAPSHAAKAQETTNCFTLENFKNK